ncbi:hypothetical protein EH31_10350 [Erythrobacter longus]|uniref:DUF4403 domain-containing protein n=1 Tax=Erythrobacter longus TaxID=1044 RepID=A0A074MAP7_ERYLO|nr:DUF4403 family protein [Erythrobacter longus]KEO90479.1 hypothetical protein EH31_10350 [Erythrobacter longus]
MIRKALFGVATVAVLLAGAAIYFIWFYVRIQDYSIPPRVETPPDYETHPSVVVTSVRVPIDQVRRGLEQDTPRTLFKINQRVEECVPRETVRIFKQNLFRTPKISCNLVGEVRRGTISLGGSGRTLSASFPVNAEIEIRDIGDIIKRETASATAIMTMRATLGVNADWRLRPDVRISYQWFEEPSVIVAGQRIKLTKFADPELRKILASVERSLEAQIRKVDLRSQVNSAWRSGFDTISLNRENPPVWLRVLPREAGTSGVRIAANSISTDLMLRADLEVFVGEEPAQPDATPLSANVGVSGGRGFDVTIPVLADYAQVEPVILRALRRLADRGIAKEELGTLNVTFETVTLYATENGRIAVGVEAEVEPVGNITGRIWGRSRGVVWLTGTPVTAPNSEVIRVEGLQVFGDMNTDIGDLLVRVLASDEVRTEIEQALVEDFAKDYEDVIGKARRGIRSVRLGDFDLSFDVADIKHGKITATGAGLFMPVSAQGSVTTKIRN